MENKWNLMFHVQCGQQNDNVLFKFISLFVVYFEIILENITAFQSEIPFIYLVWKVRLI